MLRADEAHQCRYQKGYQYPDLGYPYPSIPYPCQTLRMGGGYEADEGGDGMGGRSNAGGSTEGRESKMGAQAGAKKLVPMAEPCSLWDPWGLFFIHLTHESGISDYKGMNSGWMNSG